MVTKGFIIQQIDEKTENSSVPPGFVSRTSFTLKRVDTNEENAFATQNDAMCDIFDIDTFKASLRLRPWVVYNHCIDNHDESDSESLVMSLQSKGWLPKGVIRGCSDRNNYQKVTARWCPEDARTAVLEEAPAFFPTEEEFEDTLKYIASIRHKAELYGICRIVPPSSWKSSCLMENKVWSSSKFGTQVQQIDELQDQYAKRQISRFHESKRGIRKRSWRIGKEHDFANESKEAGCNETKGFKFENGPEFTCETFKKYADDFKRVYFCKKAKAVDSNISSTVFQKKWDPSVDNIEGEYWRIVENQTEQIEVLSGADLDNRAFGGGFPAASSSAKLPVCSDYMDSAWNLNNIPKLPGSLLSFGNYDRSNIFEPRMQIGMCFSSTSWKVDEHHVYSLCYMHLGAPKIWYGIPGRYSLKFEAAVKKHFPGLLAEHPERLHELVTQLSPSLLKSEGIPVCRCIQYPREFVLVLPGAYHSGFDTGFNCTEVVNFAPMDWLPHGQSIVELYREKGRKTSMSHDKLLLRAATEAVRAQWEISLRKKSTTENLVWKDACGKDGILTKALKSRVKLECLRREYLCSSSQCQKMDAATSKRECSLCLYDLCFSAAVCSCSPNQYSCLNHAKQMCSCPWSEKAFLFCYEIEELNGLVEALEGKLSAVYKWAKDHLGLSLRSFASKASLQAPEKRGGPTSTSLSKESKEKKQKPQDLSVSNGGGSSTVELYSDRKAQVLHSRSSSDLEEGEIRTTLSASRSRGGSAEDGFSLPTSTSLSKESKQKKQKLQDLSLPNGGSSSIVELYSERKAQVLHSRSSSDLEEGEIRTTSSASWSRGSAEDGFSSLKHC